jgi:predicted TIM-barrel fold metal-dependent hydrolase
MNTNHKVDTRMPYRIDVHHHVMPPFYLEALERAGKRIKFGIYIPDWTLEAHLAVMDKNKIAAGVASISAAGINLGSSASAHDLARRCNEFLASLCREHPTRFGAFASLPVPDVDAALREAEYALDTLRLDGVLMLSNEAGRYVGDPDYGELFAELDRRGSVVCIHPGDPPDEGIPASILYPIDTAMETARAAMSLLYGGVLEHHPNVRFIFSHCGGITPFLAHRIARGGKWVRREGGADPGMLDRDQGGGDIEKAVGLLQRQYYDSMTANGANGFRTLQAFVDASHILLGTDHAILPAMFQPRKMRELKRYKGFDDEMRMGVERGNALRLFPRLKEVIES